MDAAWLAVGLAPLIVGAWLVARHGLRVEPGPARTLAAAVLAWAWMTAGVEALGGLGRLDRGALAAWSAVALAAGLVARSRRRAGVDPDAAAGPAGPIGLAAALGTALVAWAGFRLGMVSFLHPVKVVSDGPIYHLYLAARWWKEGRIFPVATPFGEVGATYFWANGELWYAWLMTVAGGDRFARIGQVPFLWLGGLAVEATARHLRIGPPAARLASLWFVAIGPQFIFAFEPNVDSLLVAGYALAAYFFLRGVAGAAPVDLRFVALGSLAAGLGMGTKPTGIVFFPPLILAAVALVARRGRGDARRVALGALAAVAPAAAMMGYWPIRNARLTGNPLYPLRVAALGRTWLEGWFGPDAMTHSHYYVPLADGRACVDILVGVFDPRLLPAWLAAAAGLWAVGRRQGDAGPAAGRAAVDRWVWGFAALGLLDLAAYWLVIPYRTQQRFSFPAIALLAIPLAALFDRAGWVRAGAVALLAVHLGTPQGWPIAGSEAEIPWDLAPAIPNYVPGLLELPLTPTALREQATLPRSWATLATGVGVLGAAWGWAGAAAAGSRERARRWARRGLATAWLAGWLVATAFCLGAHVAIPFPFFRPFLAGWYELEARSGPRGARVAYAGTNIPYYLLGSKLQNDVRYVNVDRHRGWLLHDYHRDAAHVGEPTIWPNPFPTWDRLRPDYAAWLANLRAEGIDLLVATRVNVDEGRENAADAERFPIERVWADAHPETFRLLFGRDDRDPRFRLYRVLPP